MQLHVIMTGRLIQPRDSCKPQRRVRRPLNQYQSVEYALICLCDISAQRQKESSAMFATARLRITSQPFRIINSFSLYGSVHNIMYWGKLENCTKLHESHAKSHFCRRLEFIYSIGIQNYSNTNLFITGKKKEFILCLLGTPLKQRKNQRSICWIASRSDRKQELYAAPEWVSDCISVFLSVNDSLIIE